MRLGNTLSDTRKAHLALVMAMAKVDGRIDENETKWLVALAIELGMEWDEINDAEMMSPKEALSKLPSSKRNRARIILDMMVCGASDGQVDEVEVNMVGATALILGFNQYEIQKILSLGMAASDEEIAQAFA